MKAFPHSHHCLKCIILTLSVNTFQRIISLGVHHNNIPKNINLASSNTRRINTGLMKLYTVSSIDNNDKVIGSSVLSDSVYETILQGKIAVVPNFVPKNVVDILRNDAEDLHRNGYFTTDALAAYGGESTTKFDPSKDRSVLKLKEWKRVDIGNPTLRHDTFGKGIMSKLRSELSYKLNRPQLDDGISISSYGIGSTEISYTRFGPGAYLKRHVDEHHEELKGKRGWEQPTRRSISWLIYLNDDDWDENKHGGYLRCFQRRVNCVKSENIGSQLNGDLQIGWLRATKEDPMERPVFMNGRRPGNEGHCALYTTSTSSSDDNNHNIQYISKDFHPDPILYLSTGDFFAQRLLIDNPIIAPRFHFIERPNNSLFNTYLKKTTTTTTASSSSNTDPFDDEIGINVPPLGGTLVLFDSVSLPHEVLPSHGRERWAASGWFHEDQQDPPHYYRS